MTDAPSNRSPSARTVAGVVLCGGKSRRMGMSKAWLPWRESWALVEIGKVLADRCEPLLLSKAPGQSLPPMPKNWRIVEDEAPEGGPLAALATAFRALDDDRLAGAVVATCDQSPGSLAELTTALLEDLSADEDRSRIFFDGERRQPFPAYYSAAAQRTIDRLRKSGVASMHAFMDAIERETDLLRPEKSFADWDDPDAYLAAAKEAGFDVPAWCQEALMRSARVS